MALDVIRDSSRMCTQAPASRGFFCTGEIARGGLSVHLLIRRRRDAYPDEVASGREKACGGSQVRAGRAAAELERAQTRLLRVAFAGDAGYSLLALFSKVVFCLQWIGIRAWQSRLLMPRPSRRICEGEALAKSISPLTARVNNGLLE